jgi:hypothetical protein
MSKTLRGCILCVQCGGMHAICTPFSQARSSSCIFLVWEKCPSSTRTTGSSFFGLTWLRNCWNRSVKLSICIQPDLQHVAFVLGGAPSYSSAFMLTLGCTRGGGGTEWPVALMQVATVMSEPLSVDDSAAICQLPFSETTLHILLLHHW